MDLCSFKTYYMQEEGENFFFMYTSEAMGSSMVDVKADEPNDGSTASLNRCWADESYRTAARIK